jgi:hypothetical protein
MGYGIVVFQLKIELRSLKLMVDKQGFGMRQL